MTPFPTPDLTESLPTEERIRVAARRVFLAKGYDGTTSRDIAKESGLNLALTNYYYRSKEKLFRLVFQDLYQQLFTRTKALLDQEMPLREKVVQLLKIEYEIVENTPDLPLFVMHELRRHPDLFSDLLPTLHSSDSVFGSQVQAAVATGEIKPLDPLQIMFLVIGNVQHPYLYWSLITHAFQLTDEELTAVVQRHKQTVQEMVLSYLFETKELSEPDINITQ